MSGTMSILAQSIHLSFRIVFFLQCPPLLSVKEHVDQQLQQVSLAYHGPEEQFSDEAGCDALQHGGCEEDSSKALLVPWVKELNHLAQSMLGFLLQAFNKQARL